jgi:hypothetical protein
VIDGADYVLADRSQPVLVPLCAVMMVIAEEEPEQPHCAPLLEGIF